MVINTISVGAAVVPTVVETYFSHYLNRKPLRQKPTAHVSYHEGLNLIRQFLLYASLHTVEDIQGFTSQWVPSPRWVRVEEVKIPEEAKTRAADVLTAQLGHHGIDKVGGSKWWQWRRDTSALQAEWIEMRAHYSKRKHSRAKSKRIMLYVHGGAYFFGSVDEHRYQMQRHARKLEARVFARMLVTLRDQGLPLPAGAILISPWVDLTHSFPSVAGDGCQDYIPAHGFMHRPSAAWPPPNSDDMEQIAMHAVEKVVGQSMPQKFSQHERQMATEAATQGFTIEHDPRSVKPAENQINHVGLAGGGETAGNTIPGPGHDLSIMLDGSLVTIKDQIQMYTTNQLLSHPLVSPVLSPTLGGLPPLLVVTGSGELLKDEQIYLAHKAADPSKYPPGGAYLDEYPEARALIQRYKPTDVQLQVWDDLCHVAPTLSFTKPAKYMFRSIAQFGAWALAKAQSTEIEIMDDDEVSLISSGTDTDSDKSDTKKQNRAPLAEQTGVGQSENIVAWSIGKAGQPLPPFKNHMIRQRVDRHGDVYPLDPPSALPALKMSANEIGVIKPGPVRKWLAAKKEWDSKFAKEKRRVQQQRIKEMVQGFQGFGDDEVPPPSALAGRRGLNMPKEKKVKRSWGMSLWSIWGSKHDESTMEREEKADKLPETAVTTSDGAADTNKSSSRKPQAKSRSRSRRRVVSFNQGKAYQDNDDADTSETGLLHLREKQESPSDRTTDSIDPTFLTLAYSPKSTTFPPEGEKPQAPDQRLPDSGTVNGESHGRPAAGDRLFPFKLAKRVGDDGENASTVTLKSYEGVATPKGGGLQQRLGDGGNASAPEGNGSVKIASQRPEIERFETAKEGL